MVITERSKVAVAICGGYESEKVYRAVSGAIKSLGGIESFVSPSERILVKPNFLYPSESERVITTHPAVISAVLRLLAEAGCVNVSVGDSPANGNCVGAMHKLGLTEDKLFGAHIADMSHEVSVDYPEGKTAKHFYFTREVTESDAIIGVCKMKTHMLERVTGGKRKPIIDASLCARCGVCVDHCPVEGKALSFAAGRSEPPVYNYKKCIRCYCCQEVCPKKAISVK